MLSPMAFAQQPYEGTRDASLRLVEDNRFTVTREIVGASVRLVLTGELDMSTTHVLEDALREETRDGRTIVIDLDTLDFIDSSGIVVLVQATKAARRSDHTLVMTRGSAPVRRVIEACVLDEFLPFTD
jgi:anti-sigma B factor antagonist